MRLGQISVAFVPDSTGLAYTFLSAPITNNHPPPPKKNKKHIFVFLQYISKEHSDPAAHHGIIAGDAGF